jgi:gluconolactonase
VAIRPSASKPQSRNAHGVPTTGEPGLPDGLAVDKQGHIWATGPGGVYCFTPDGKLIGRLKTGQRTANCKFGDDGKTLFICADMYFCRVKTNATGTNY